MVEITRLWIPFETHPSDSEEKNLETTFSYFQKISDLSKKGWEIIEVNPVTKDLEGNVLLFELYFEKTGKERKGCDCGNIFKKLLNF